MDVGKLALEVVDLLERRDIDAVRGHFAERLTFWDPAPFLDSTWDPTLDALAGAGREIVGGAEIVGDPPAAKVTVRGDRGNAFIALGFDPDGRLEGIVLDPPAHGMRNIVIGAPRGEWRNDRIEGEPRELAFFYADLLDMKLVREDWLKISRWTRPEVAFGDGWSDEHPPRWPDPDHPQQGHLDIAVSDLDAAHDRVLERGARVLQERDGFRSYADLVGHPFCLYADASVERPEIVRVVFDGPEPSALADFYAELLALTDRVEETSDRIVIARPDRDGPMLGFQRSDSEAPRWPDPAYPAQIHIDMYFDDGMDASRRAEGLGATRLPKDGWGRVYADPAGHPFCVTSPQWS